MTAADVAAAISYYQGELGVPVTDALMCSPKHLVEMVFEAFPDLQAKLPTAA
jgi:hypothetical protein